MSKRKASDTEDETERPTKKSKSKEMKEPAEEEKEEEKDTHPTFVKQVEKFGQPDQEASTAFRYILATEVAVTNDKGAAWLKIGLYQPGGILDPAKYAKKIFKNKRVDYSYCWELVVLVRNIISNRLLMPAHKKYPDASLCVMIDRAYIWCKEGKVAAYYLDFRTLDSLTLRLFADGKLQLSNNVAPDEKRVAEFMNAFGRPELN